MLICIDARPLEKNMAGIGMTIKNVLSVLLKKDKENMYLLVSDRNIDFDIKNYKNLKVLKYKSKWYCPKSFYYFYCLSGYLKNHNIIPDVFWGTQHILPKNLPNRCNKVLTIHDFTHLYYPKTTTLFNRIILRFFLKKSIKESDSIACVSNNTMSDLIKLFNEQVKNKNITVISPGGIEMNKKGIMDSHGSIRNEIYKAAKEKYILFVGTIEPRKNIKLLLKAAPKLKPEFHVVICGKIGWESKQTINALKHTENVTYLNYVNLSERDYLMNHCFCQIQPSVYEGFGMPVVECMQNGSISLVADNSSLKEIVEIPELKFSTYDAEDFCNKLYDLNDPVAYKKANDYCKARGTQFSWEKTAFAYYKLFTNKSL